MKNFLFFALLLLACCFSSCTQHTDITLDDTHKVPAPSSNVVGDTSISDSLILVHLYQTTEGEDWWKQGGWLHDPLEYWKGVKVEMIDGKKRVVELRLGANNLRGEIPVEIGLLSELRALDLKYNYHLKGEIPEELFNLKKLKALYLGFTSLTGKLSSKIGQLTELDTLSLRTSPWDHFSEEGFEKNELVLQGDLPKEIGLLKNIRFIDTGYQGFSGSLPMEIGKCCKLEELDLNSNHFEGKIPASLGQLSRLKRLQLRNNRFTGTIPEEIGNLTALEVLYLSYNALEGEIPATFGQMKKLWKLSLAHNRLSGIVPTAMSQMDALNTVFISYNQLEGDFPEVLTGRMHKNLSFVDASYNNFTGNIPVHFGTTFFLEHNRLTGNVPEKYFENPKLLRDLMPQQEGYGFDNLTMEEALLLMPPEEENNPNLIDVPFF